MTIIEMNVGLIVMCMPPVATVIRTHSPLLTKLWTSLGGKLCSISLEAWVRRRNSSDNTFKNNTSGLSLAYAIENISEYNTTIVRTLF